MTEHPFPYEGPEELRQPILTALRRVVDPEVALNVVDVGLIYGVTVADGKLHAQVTMTSAACPVTDVILEDIETQLDRDMPPELLIQVELVWSPPWSTERITEVGRRKLKEFGLAPPTRCHGSPVSESMLHQGACPYCDSGDTTLESIFGPTLCRAIHYCNSCRQSFEQFKPV